MSRKCNISSNSDMKRFMKDLEEKALREAEKQIRQKGLEIECPNCHAAVRMKPGEACPSCGCLFRLDTR